MKLSRVIRAVTAYPSSVLLIGMAICHAQESQPLQVAEIKHEGQVDFEKEILPILRRSCLACHSVSVAESDLVLESPQTILQGGVQGPAVVPRNADKSLVFNVAAHLEEPVMPPAGNDKNAPDLTATELGLLKLWINQGAKGEVSKNSESIAWQPLPASFNPIYAAALAPDGRMAAASRANQVSLYSVASRQDLGRLTDPDVVASGIYKVTGVAHLDLVQSLAFSADGERLASGAFRTVTIWRRPHNARAAEFQVAEEEVRTMAVSPNRRWAAVGQANGQIAWYETFSGQRIRTLVGHTQSITSLSFSADGRRLASGSTDKTVRLWDAADGQETSTVDMPKKVTALAFVLGDSQLAVAGEDNLIRTFAIAAARIDAQQVQQMSGHSATITSLARLTHDGKQLLSGSLDGTARKWDSARGNELAQFSDGGPILTIAVRSDGGRIVTAGELGKAKLWNAENGQLVTELTTERAVVDDLEDVRLALDLAKRHALNAKTDYDQALKDRASEQENVYAAVMDVAKSEVDVKKKSAAAVQPVADKQKADEALLKIRAELEAAIVARKKLDEPGTQLTDNDRKQQDTAIADFKTKVAQAEQVAAKLDGPAKAAVSDKMTAEQLHQAARLAVTRAHESAAKVRERVVPAKALYEERMLAEKRAQDELAMAERLLGIRAKKVINLEGKKINADRITRETEARRQLTAAIEAAGGLKAMAEMAAVEQHALENQLAEANAEFAKAKDEATKTTLMAQIADLTQKKDQAAKKSVEIADAAKAAMAAQAASSQAFVEASQALEAAREAAMGAGMQAETLVQQTNSLKSMAERNDADVEAQHKARLNAADVAEKALDVAQKKLADAPDESTKTLAIAEVANAVLKKQTADEDLAQSTSARAAAAQAKVEIEKKLLDAQSQAKRMEEQAKQSLAAAEAAFQQAHTKLHAADATAGGLQAQLQTALQLKDVATIALTEVRKPLRSVAFSPDGVQLAIVGDDQVIRVFNGETGEPIDPITGQGSELIGAAFLDNTRLLALARNKSLVVWDTLPQWTLERRIGSVDDSDQLVDRVTALSFSPDGKLLATAGGEASRSGELKFWNAETGQLVLAVASPHSDAILSLDFSPEGKYIATGGADRFLKVFEVATGKLIQSFEGHTQHVLGVSWRADGRILATAGADKVVKIWDFKTGELVQSFPAVGKEVTSVQFLAASDSLVMGTGDNQVSIRTGDGGTGPTYKGSTDYVYAVQASKTGHVIAAGGQDSVLRIWSNQGRPIANFSAP